ncbi:hypothetical protein ABIC94_003928 [Variovorax paradoxus]
MTGIIAAMFAVWALGFVLGWQMRQIKSTLYAA